MGNNKQDPKQIIDVENDDNSSLIDKIIDIFSSNTTTGLFDDVYESNDSDWLK